MRKTKKKLFLKTKKAKNTNKNIRSGKRKKQQQKCKSRRRGGAGDNCTEDYRKQNPVQYFKNCCDEGEKPGIFSFLSSKRSKCNKIRDDYGFFTSDTLSKYPRISDYFRQKGIYNADQKLKEINKLYADKFASIADSFGLENTKEMNEFTKDAIKEQFADSLFDNIKKEIMTLDKINPFLLAKNEFTKEIPKEVEEYLRNELQEGLFEKGSEDEKLYLVSQANLLREAALKQQMKPAQTKQNNFSAVEASGVGDNFDFQGELLKFENELNNLDLTEEQRAQLLASEAQVLQDRANKFQVNTQEVPDFYYNLKMKIKALPPDKKRRVAEDLYNLEKAKLQLLESDTRYLSTIESQASIEQNAYNNKRKPNKLSPIEVSLNDELNSQLKDHGYEIIKSRGDGNCYLYSFLLADGAISLPNSNQTRQQLTERMVRSLILANLLRKELVKYINNDNLDNLQLSDEQYAATENMDIETKKKFLQKLVETSSFFFDNFSIGIMQNLLDYQSIIIERSSQIRIFPNNFRVNVEYNGRPTIGYVRKVAANDDDTYSVELENKVTLRNITPEQLRFWNMPQYVVSCQAAYNESNPNKYIIFLRVGNNHFDLITYRKSRIFTFETLPLSMKSLIKHSCSRVEDSFFNYIPKFREYFARS